LTNTAYRKTNLELSIKILDEVKQLAEKENLTMSQWVERAIQQALKRDRNGRSF
jgi:post-segregation antitoxin (ccd killing protein)